MTRGSQRSSASRIACSILPTVEASIVSKTKSCTPQPNSGRIGRSPGAVREDQLDRLLDVRLVARQRDAAAAVHLEGEREA